MANDAPQHADPNRLNLSVAKAAAILRAAAALDGGSVSALARAAGLPRATALRMIEALTAEGLLVRIRDRDTVLIGPSIRDLARAAAWDRVLVSVARPLLESLGAATGETITLAVPYGDELLGIDEVRGSHLVGPFGWVGRTWPLDTTAGGRVMRGHHRDAYAESVDELEIGLAGIAAPIRFGGDIVAVVGVSGPTFRFDVSARRVAAVPLCSAAAEIGARLFGG
jgi:DNA-binding IclR family transcriptional regulator